MYLNRIKMGSLGVLYNVLMGIGGALAIFAVISFLTAFEHTELFAVILFMIVVPNLLIVAGLFGFALFGKKRLYRAEAYNRIFEEDHDGKIPYEVLSSLTGYSLPRVKNDIAAMTRNGTFRNVTYGRTGAMIIMKAETANDFITVYCPTCAGEVKMRVGGGARCSFCGTYFRSEGQDGLH